MTECDWLCFRPVAHDMDSFSLTGLDSSKYDGGDMCQPLPYNPAEPAKTTTGRKIHDW